jgi:hypothetical protein
MKSLIKKSENVGFNEGKYPTQVGKKRTREYNLWQCMLSRCMPYNWVRNPSYVGTTCSENFKSFTFFYEWCHTQIGFNSKDEKGRSWQIDKDLLIKGNKIYSEDTCCFVPKNINTLLTKSNSSRGKQPIGVFWNESRGSFRAICSENNKLKHLGCFKTKDSTFSAYKLFKERLIKAVAEVYKGQIDERVYTALMNYQVSDND